MSSRLVLTGLCAAPLAVLAVAAGLAVAPPRTGAPPTGLSAPTVGIWRVVCPPNRDGWQGPYTNADDCRTALRWAQGACRHPLIAPNVPDPTFLRYAETCRDAYDATTCHCDFLHVVARGPTPTELLFPASAQ